MTKINNKVKMETIRNITYIADFKYEEDKFIIFEDVKSEITRKDKNYILKKKLLLKALSKGLTYYIFREYDKDIKDYILNTDRS